MTDKILRLIEKDHPLTPIDCGEFAKMKVSGMNFNISAYKAAGLGHVSVMTASGMLGLMKMDTLIINPTELDLPLYSYDRIFAMGNDTLITELYDTTLGKFSEVELLQILAEEKYKSIPERDPGEHWYDSIKLSCSISKKGKKAQTTAINSLTEQHFNAYLLTSASAISEREKKQEKARVYVNGLIEKGGPSTDVFKKAIGEEKTRVLFENILFGTK